jgi:NADPH-dependent glutamate synthase beta subunit-like oxidoreductase
MSRLVDAYKAAKSIVTGLGITFKQVPKRAVTLRYPEVKPPLSPVYRGAPMLKAIAGDGQLTQFRAPLQEFNAMIKEKEEGEELPPCVGTCPAHTDARGYVNLIAAGKYQEALELIRQRCTLPASLGRICHHPCETKCRRGYYDQPVSIRALKRFVADACRDLPRPKPLPKTRNKRIAIIGSGPAGLTAAYDLVKEGYEITIYEKNRTGGGALLTGVPKYRLPKDILAWDVEAIISLGINFRTGVEIGKDIPMSKLLEDYDAVIIAVGLQVSRSLPIEGIDADGVQLALPFLRAVNIEGSAKVGKKTVVIGGGNVAIDVARSAKRVGQAEVSLYCLESRNEMPAFSWEIEEAIEEGVEINPSWGPNKIFTKNGKVVGMSFKRCLSVFDEQGRFAPKFCEEETVEVEADTVIIAIGQASELSFLKGTDIEVDERGRLKFDRETFQTSNPKVFACGEVVTGPGSAVGSIATGHEAAISVDRFLRGEDLRANRIPSVVPDYEGPYENIYLELIEPERLRVMVSMEEPEVRVKDFREIEYTLSEEEAIQEAFRCLTCLSRACIGCTFCARTCPDYAIVVERPKPTKGAKALVSYNLDLGLCMFCGLCAEQCPTKALVMSKDFELGSYTRSGVVFDKETMQRKQG